jgi:hypothetical protein
MVAAIATISHKHHMEGDLKMPVLLPYLVGVVTAPLAARVIKPVVRGVVKTTVAAALEVKRAAAEAGEEFQDIAAEVSVEKGAVAEAGKVPTAGVAVPKETRVGGASTRGTT